MANKKTKTKTKNKVVHRPTIVSPEPKEKVSKKMFEVVQKIWECKVFDILFMLLIMWCAILFHSYALDMNGVPEEQREYFLDEEGLPYLYDMDSYYYATVTKGYVDGTAIQDLNKYRVYKRAREYENAEHVYFSRVTAWIYKLVAKFNKELSLNRFLIYIPCFYSCLACIPAYIFVRRRCKNRLGAIMSGVMGALSTASFGHNGIGCLDTDSLTVFLPLCFICMFIEAIEDENNKTRFIWLFGSMVFLGFFAHVYPNAYQIYYYLTLGMSFVYILTALIQEKWNVKNAIMRKEVQMSLLGIVIFTTVCVLISGFSGTFSVVEAILNVLAGQSGFNTTNYPDAGKFVSELSSMPWFADGTTNPFDTTAWGVVNRIGGIGMALLVIVGLFILASNTFTYFDGKKEFKNKYISFIVLAAWTIAGIISLKSGNRFVKLFSVPCIILCGYGFGLMYDYFTKRGLKISAIALFIALLFNPIYGAYSIGYAFNVSIDDALEQMSTWIRDNTEPDDVIASWWDYGYYYHYQAERRTLGDGGTFDGQYYYFLANGILSTDEKQSAQLFKMLAGSGLECSDLIEEYMGSAKEGSKLLVKILKYDKEEGRKMLIEKGLTEKQADKIIELAYPELPYDVYFVVSEDMLRKRTAFSYYAFYDFDTDDVHQLASYDDTVLNRLYIYGESKTDNFELVHTEVDPQDTLSSRVWKIKK